MKKLTKKKKEDIEFNNGFITAIGLFLAHERDEWNQEDKERRLTIYCATDHLFDLEVPEELPVKLKDNIKKALNLTFKYRLAPCDSKITGMIFQKWKDILKEIDEFLWKKEVHINYY